MSIAKVDRVKFPVPTQKIKSVSVKIQKNAGASVTFSAQPCGIKDNNNASGIVHGAQAGLFYKGNSSASTRSGYFKIDCDIPLDGVIDFEMEYNGLPTKMYGNLEAFTDGDYSISTSVGSQTLMILFTVRSGSITRLAAMLPSSSGLDKECTVSINYLIDIPYRPGILEIQKPQEKEVSLSIIDTTGRTETTEKATIMGQIGTMQIGEPIIYGGIIFNYGTSTRVVTIDEQIKTEIQVQHILRFEFTQGSKKHYVLVAPVVSDGTIPPDGWHCFSFSDDAGNIVFCFIHITAKVVDKINMSLFGNAALENKLTWTIIYNEQLEVEENGL